MLGGFAPGYGNAQLNETAYRFNVPAVKLPAAVLAREVMVATGAEDRGRADKVAWRYGDRDALRRVSPGLGLR